MRAEYTFGAKSVLRFCGTSSFCGAMLVVALTVDVRAQAPRSSTATSRAAAAPAVRPPLDTAAQHAFLSRDDWREMMRDLDDWFALQTLYTPEQVRRFKERLAAGIDKMSAEELQRFMQQMKEKLAILRGEAATGAAEYIARTQEVASPAYIARLRERLPDILSMTPGQVETRLAGLSLKHRSNAQLQDAFNESRRERIAAARAARAAAEQQQVDSALAASAAAASQPQNFIKARNYDPTVGYSFNTGYDGYAGVTWDLTP